MVVDESCCRFAYHAQKDRGKEGKKEKQSIINRGVGQGCVRVIEEWTRREEKKRMVENTLVSEFAG